MGVFGRFRRNDRGAAAVEFALVSVLLFTLLFGIIQYGFLFFQYQAAAATAHEAVRSLVIGPTDTEVVSGIETGCPPWAQDVADLGRANGLPADRITRVRVLMEPAGAPFERAALVRVVVTFSPTAFGAAFVPMPGQIEVSAAGTVEAVGAITGPCDVSL